MLRICLTISFYNNYCLSLVFYTLTANNTFELTGNGDVLEPQYGVMGVGSGGTYALAAALALMDQVKTDNPHLI